MKMPRWLDDVLAWLTPPCREVVRWASQDLDGVLTWHQRVRMRMHFVICDLCKRYQQQLAVLRALLRSDPERLLGDDAQKLSPEAKQHLKEMLREQQPPHD
ncbi:MAG: zf-HC2 domain-containing protein [Gammaproteobacteria bacterium]|nr:zf-HC2 domain-containing protein [Gammaproteobacteria bacterium]